MQVSEVDEYSAHDPVVNTFRIFGKLHNVAVSGEVSVIPTSAFAETLANRAGQIGSEMLLLPWSETGNMSESQFISNDSVRKRMATSAYNAFVASTLDNAECTVAVFVNSSFGGATQKNKDGRPGFSRTVSMRSVQSLQENLNAAPPPADRSHHIFCPFVGGADDRAALRLALQMAENSEVTATLVHIEASDAFYAALEPTDSRVSSSKVVEAAPAVDPSLRERDSAFFSALERSLPTELASRVIFESTSGVDPMSEMLERAKREVGLQPRNAGDVVVLGRNATRAAALQDKEPQEGSPAEARRSLGVMAEALVRSGIRASVLVVQAREGSE